MKKNKLILLLLFTNSLAYTQSVNPHVIKKYNFINYKKNKIEFTKNNPCFDTLFYRFDSIIFQGKSNVNILHFGGSHIQADIWSNKIRTHFQHFAPEMYSSRGFVFPYKLAKTNNSSAYHFSSNTIWKGYRASLSKHQTIYGLSAITATTQDSNATINFSFSKAEKKNNQFDRIKILHNTDSIYYNINCVYPKNALKQSSQNQGFTYFYFNKKVDSFSLKLEKTNFQQSSFMLYGILINQENGGVIYNSIGVNGASTSTYLRCQLFDEHLKHFKPHLIIFSIGLNDTYSRGYNKQIYFNNCDTLIQKIRKIAPQCAIIFTTNSDSYIRRRYPNKKIYSATKVMYKLAKKYHAGVWNLFEVMGKLKSINKWQQHKLAKRDKVHFTSKGYNLIGDLFFSALVKSYDIYLQTKYGHQN